LKPARSRRRKILSEPSLDRAIHGHLWLIADLYAAIIHKIGIEKRNQRMTSQRLSLWRSYLLCFLVCILAPAPYAHGADAPLRLEPLLSKNTRLMVFSPHPDDESLAAAGLVQRVLRLGGAVKVVFMTSGDGFPEGVEKEMGIGRPTADDYRNYGKVRKKEARQALHILGLKKQDIVFLNFPDGGLHNLLQKHWIDRHPYFRSPFTLEDRPQLDDALLPNIEFTGEDVKRELEKLLLDFHPSLIAVADPRDQHPDHCSTYFFVSKSLKAYRKSYATLDLKMLTYLIHFRQWPIGGGAGMGTRLNPPGSFPQEGSAWTSLSLSDEELANKRKCLMQYNTQMLVMGRYLMSFARANELFLIDSENAPLGPAKLQCLGLK
jgi:LmbE family N-acetylglucosaminyl deacetylase